VVRCDSFRITGRTLALGPVLQDPLGATGDRQCAVGHVVTHRGSATGHRVVADPDRGDEGVVGAGLGVVADRGPVLVGAVVVGEDRAGPDVGLLADLGVSDVGQVRDLGAVPDLGVLGLDVRPD